MKKFLIILFVISFSNAFSQNEYHISQYFYHKPFINPATINENGSIGGALLYRKQWLNFKGSPQIIGFSFYTPIKFSGSSIGLTIINDRIGVDNDFSITVPYAYKIELQKKIFLSFALSPGIRFLQSKNNELLFNDEGDQYISGNSSFFGATDVKLGFFLNNDKFYFGFSTPNLLNAQLTKKAEKYSVNTGFNLTEVHYFTNFGVKTVLNKDWTFSPSILIKSLSGSPFQFDVNLMFQHKKTLGFGLAYQTSKNIIYFMNLELNDYWRIGYSYDYSFEKLRNVSYGTHEIILLFDLKEKRKHLRVISPRL